MPCRYHLDNNYLDKPLCFDGIDILQIGRMYCDLGNYIDPHAYDLYELTVVTGGKGDVFTDGVPTPVTVGDIYISFPGDTHAIVSSDRDPLKFDFFSFHCRREPYMAALSHLAQVYHSPVTRVFHDEWVPRLVSRVIGELHHQRTYREELLGSLLHQIVISVLRAFEQVQPALPHNTATPAEVLCYQMMNYVDTHIYTLHELQEVADALGYSYGYLSALYRRTTGDTLSHYYSEKKAQLAGLLVKEGRMSITEIATQLGYANVYAFSKAFRKRFGVSPRAYRELF